GVPPRWGGRGGAFGVARPVAVGDGFGPAPGNGPAGLPVVAAFARVILVALGAIAARPHPRVVAAHAIVNRWDQHVTRPGTAFGRVALAAVPGPVGVVV